MREYRRHHCSKAACIKTYTSSVCPRGGPSWTLVALASMLNPEIISFESTAVRVLFCVQYRIETTTAADCGRVDCSYRRPVRVTGDALEAGGTAALAPVTVPSPIGRAHNLLDGVAHLPPATYLHHILSKATKNTTCATHHDQAWTQAEYS